MKKNTIIILVMLVLFTNIIGLNTSTFADDGKHHVLFLQSYETQNSWARDISRGFFETIDTQRGSILVYEEFMDTKRYRSDEHYDNFTTYFENKYHDVEFSLVITADNNAFDYVAERNSDFFGDVPVVFVGLNPTESNRNLSDRFSGVYEEVDVESTLNIISQIHPNDSRIMIVTDETVTGQAVLTSVRQAVKNFEGKQKVEFFMSSNLESIEEKMDGLSKMDAVLMLVFNADDTGRNYTYNEGLDEIHKRCPAPIYGMWKFYLGQGIVGGYLTDGYEHGKVAAEHVIAKLQGVEPRRDYQEQVKPVLYFDYLEMKQFGLESIALPNDAITINRPTEGVREMIPAFIGISLTTALVVLIIALWYLNKKEHLMNDALEAEKARLESLIDQDLNRMVDERTLELMQSNKQCEILKDEFELINTENDELKKKLHSCNQESKGLMFRSKSAVSTLVQLDMSLRLYHIFLKGNMKTAIHVKELIMEIGVSNEKMKQIENLYEDGVMKRSDLENYLKNRKLAIGRFEERLKEIVHDTQQLIDTELFDISIESAPQSISSALLNAFNIARIENSNRLIEFHKDIEEELPETKKPGLLVYVILQILSNALHHAFDGLDAGHVTLKALKEGNSIIIEVLDSGLGMKEYVIEKAFDPFYTTKGERGYLGIGLGNVKDVIENRFSGHVEIHSEMDQGTRIRLEIPIKGV